MIWPDKIMALENRSFGDHWEPMLGEALELAIGEWNTGNREREFRLHLLFLAWYCNLEPSHITGYNEPTPSDQLEELFSAVYETFADSILDDAEVLYVVGLMAELTPWSLGGDQETWEARADEYHNRYRALVPDGLSPAFFEGRGAYGDYFAGMVQAKGGF